MTSSTKTMECTPTLLSNLLTLPESARILSLWIQQLLLLCYWTNSLDSHPLLVRLLDRVQREFRTMQSFSRWISCNRKCKATTNPWADSSRMLKVTRIFPSSKPNPRQLSLLSLSTPRPCRETSKAKIISDRLAMLHRLNKAVAATSDPANREGSTPP